MCPISWTLGAMITVWNATHNRWEEVALCLPKGGVGAAYVERKGHPVKVPLENIVIAGRRYWIINEKEGK